MHVVYRGWIRNSEEDIKLTELEIARKEEELQDEEENVDMHRQGAKQLREQEKKLREDAREKWRDAELFCGLADAKCAQGLPMRSMGNFAAARPILEKARELQLEGQEWEREAEKMLEAADFYERKFDLLLGRAIAFAQECHQLSAQVAELKEKLGWQKLALEREQKSAEEKKKECLKLGEEGEKIGKKASELENQVQFLRQQASEAEDKAYKAEDELLYSPPTI